MTRIRQSDNADIVAILGWLRAEYEQAGTGRGFWCNRSIIASAHEEGRLVVADDGDTERAIAFQVGGLLHPGILVVRPDKRGMGFGRRLVEYCIARAVEEDECVLHIDCKPVSSVPFWKHMGFRLFSDAFCEFCPSDVTNHAFRILERRHNVRSSPEGSVEIGIHFRTECGFTLNHLQVGGMKRDDRRVALPCRATSYCPARVFCGDTFVDVQSNGRPLYSGKAKYEEAKAIGVQNHNGEVYFIDEVILPLRAADIPRSGPE